MSNTHSSVRLWIATAVVAAAGAAGIAYAVAGNELQKPAAERSEAADQSPVPHPAASPANKLLGLPVVAAGGETVGQVLEYGPGGTGKTLSFKVKVVSDLGPDGSTVRIPEDRTVVNGRAIQLSITLDDVKRMMAN